MIHFQLVMASYLLTYVSGDTPVHRVDARVKIVALLAFSIGIFFVRSWPVLAAFACAAVAATAIARIPAGTLTRMLAPVLVLAGFSFACNVVAHPGWEGVSSGGFFAVRMVVLVAASFVVCLTTTSTQLLDAFTQIMEPLRRLRVPVDDVATTLALSIRFIPVIEREFARIRAAQMSRGGGAATSFVRRAQVLGGAFAALFVGLFRHADAVACAMDVRCYGASERRTHLQ